MNKRIIILALCALAIAAGLLHGQFGTEAPSTLPVRSAAVAPTPSPVAARSESATTQPRSGATAPGASYAADSAAATRSLPVVQRTREHDMIVRIDAPATGRVGDRLKISVVAQAHAPVGRYSFLLRYDPSVLKSVSATDGDFMEQGSALAKFTENAATSNGEIVIGAEQDGGAGVEGTGSVAVVLFQAIAPGSASITLANLEAYTGHGNAVIVAAPESRTLTILRAE